MGKHVHALNDEDVLFRAPKFSCDDIEPWVAKSKEDGRWYAPYGPHQDDIPPDAVSWDWVKSWFERCGLLGLARAMAPI